MGGDARLVPEPAIKHEYLCHFKNVCYSTVDDKFIYYSDPQSTDEIIRTVQHNFEQSFADDYMQFILKSVQPKIEISKEGNGMPKGQMHLRDNIVMHYSLMYYAYNYLLIDTFYAQWRTLNYFDLYSFEQSRPLWFGYESKQISKDYRYINDGNGLRQSSWDHSQLTNEIGLRFINETMQYLWAQKPLFLHFRNDTQMSMISNSDLFQAIFEDINGNALVCFDSIVIEMGYYFRHWDLSYFWKLFIDQTVQKNKKQKILILSQNGADERRHFSDDTNVTQIAQYLSDLFGVSVECANSNEIYLSNLSLSAQIEFISQFSVVIHNGGDDSYIHWFMREGSALITMDWFDDNGKYSVHFDSDNIEFDPSKKTFYYFMRESDMQIIESKQKKRNVKFDSKNVYKYKLDPQRLAMFVNSALLWVEHWNDWTDSFTRINNEIPPMTR